MCIYVCGQNADCEHGIWPRLFGEIQKWSNQVSVNPLVHFFVSVLCCLKFQIQISWNSWGLALIHLKPLKHCFYVAFFGQLWLCPLLVWFLDPETSEISLCLPCEMLLRVLFSHRRSLSCFLMPLWSRQPRPRWRRDSLSLLLRTNNGHSASGEPLSQ